MKNIDKVRAVFLSDDIKNATNAEILSITGIKPHQQVYQLTAKLVSEGFLQYTKNGREKVFFVAKNANVDREKSSKSIHQISTYRSDDVIEQKSNNIGENVSKGVQILLDVGFELSGVWVIDNDTIKNKISKHGSSTKILYAFVSENKVLYLGKTIRSLS